MLEAYILRREALVGTARVTQKHKQGAASRQAFTVDRSRKVGKNAFPLLLFAIAARKLPYSTLGFIQFLAPSIVFILGLTVFGEELKPAQAACFACIWLAAAIFVWDLVARSRKQAARQVFPPR